MADIPRVFTQTFGVAGAIIENDGKILLVQEHHPGHPDHGKWNHPAGWIDVGEDPRAAAEREVREETGYTFVAEHLLGVYSLVRVRLQEELQATPHALKFLFIGRLTDAPRQPLHGDIAATQWFSPEEIYTMNEATLRDEDIKTAVRDYFAGTRYPLACVQNAIVR